MTDQNVHARSSVGMTIHPQGLLAAGAGIHIDFHSDDDFDNLWCLPGRISLRLLHNRYGEDMRAKFRTTVHDGRPGPQGRPPQLQ
jgi:hypothetical protein